jgi:hypothetical protein
MNQGYIWGLFRKKWRPKIRCYCPFKASFWFPQKQTVLKILLIAFLNHPELKKRDKKVVKLAGDDRELRNCGSQILKVRNRSSATFFSPQFRNRFCCPQYCGIAEVRTKIADVHLCPYALTGMPCGIITNIMNAVSTSRIFFILGEVASWQVSSANIEMCVGCH